jgi:hypothetical protein
MIKKSKGCIEINCDIPYCDSTEELFIDDMITFKEEIREAGWHLRKHSRCVCMDCWDAGER